MLSGYFDDSYLKPGAGDPCAGQVKATPLSTTILKARESRIEENLGLADPIGSTTRVIHIDFASKLT